MLFQSPVIRIWRSGSPLTLGDVNSLFGKVFSGNCTASFKIMLSSDLLISAAADLLPVLTHGLAQKAPASVMG